MATALIAAAAAAIVASALALALRAQRVRSDRRIQSLLEQVDRSLGAISEILERVVSRSLGARAVRDLELTVNLDDLLRRVAAEAAARTHAVAAVVRVQGVGGDPAIASFGAEDGAALPQAPPSSGARPFRALTINWAYGSAAEHADDSFTSVLVVPIVEDGVETGSLAAYARGPAEFDAAAVRALEALAEDAAPAITSARRFSETELALTDAATGVRNRQGYELELERAVARARSSGLALSVLVLSIRRGDGLNADDEDALEELAVLLLQQTRGADVVGRRRAGELGIVLPETTGEATRRLYVRLREQAARMAFSRQTTFAAGVAEWRPNETSEALDARAQAAVGRSRVDELTLGAPHTARTIEASRSSEREAFDARLVHAVGRARRLAQPLSLLTLDLDVSELEQRLGEQTVERVVEHVEARIEASLANGDLSCRIARDVLAVMLPGSSPAQAERLLASVRSSLERDPPDAVEQLVLSAGITEVVGGDDAESALGRAEHALQQARKAGPGTVVVAMPNREDTAK